MTETSGDTRGLKTIVTASAAGTTFEWYDFYIFATLSALISKNFFAGLSDTLATLATLLTFAVGFIARPVGAMIFGHIGDRKGRKGTFLYTILLMGLATVAIGFLPTYSQAGAAAPLLLILLRVVQGIALGGEYGGAAIYVAEHAPSNKRGGFTGWIQTAASAGLIAALGVTLATRAAVGEDAFAAWGWRIPFIISAGLLAVSVYIRAKAAESPAFAALRAEQGIAKSPLSEVLSRWSSLKGMLIALFGFMTAQGAVFYSIFFYTQVFLSKTVRLDDVTMNWLIMGASLVAACLYVAFANLSDRIGRKPVMIFGMALACISFFPAFHLLVAFGNPDLEAASKRAPVQIVADPAQCTFQFDLSGTAQFTSPCDLAKSLVIAAGVPYVNKPLSGQSTASVVIGETAVEVASGAYLGKADLKALKTKTTNDIKAALKAAGYPEKADPKKANLWGLFGVLSVLAVAATALYGPMAAALVEMFPTRIRYTAMSIPYNIGTGWFGGLQPALSFAMVTATGDIFFGLWYPVVICVLAIIVAVLFMKETKGRDLHTIAE